MKDGATAGVITHGVSPVMSTTIDNCDIQSCGVNGKLDKGHVVLKGEFVEDASSIAEVFDNVILSGLK